MFKSYYFFETSTKTIYTIQKSILEKIMYLLVRKKAINCTHLDMHRLPNGNFRLGETFRKGIRRNYYGHTYRGI